MKLLFGFVVGYFVGTRPGRTLFERVERAAHEIWEYDELRRAVSAVTDRVRPSRSPSSGSEGPLGPSVTPRPGA